MARWILELSEGIGIANECSRHLLPYATELSRNYREIACAGNDMPELNCLSRRDDGG